MCDDFRIAEMNEKGEKKYKLCLLVVYCAFFEKTIWASYTNNIRACYYLQEILAIKKKKKFPSLGTDYSAGDRMGPGMSASAGYFHLAVIVQLYIGETSTIAWGY